ncbi:MAG: preprotein translocase subunit SecG [Methylacidiphilales bacterium]|nr:preprotein translocase subunit SecG [Candidatus Methylacidiphilales bacterium]
MLFWINASIDVLLVLFVIDCILMGLVILMQRSKQEGLGAAFGGGFTESVWGAQTSQVLVKATAWFAALFFILSIGLARLYAERSTIEGATSTLQQELLKPVAPISTNAVSTPALPVPASAATTPAPAATIPLPVPPSSAPAAPAKPTAK